MKTFDTFAKTTYLIKLAADPKVYTRKVKHETKGEIEVEDVVLTFADNSRIEGTLDVLWVDARVRSFINNRAKKYAKGDILQVTGKLRIRLQDDGTVRGKMYDVDVDSFVATAERETPGDAEASKPVFE